MVMITVLFIISSVDAQQNIHALNHFLDNKMERPVPYPVIPSPQFINAIKKGTRSMNGTPGPKYWMNKASYTIDAVLSPDLNLLQGKENIKYTNESPDTLKQLVIELRQNLYKAGNIRNNKLKLTGGINVTGVLISEKPILAYNSTKKIGYHIDGTIMRIRLEHPLAPKQSIQLQFTWNFNVPPPKEDRMGQDGEVYYLGYWYPQMAVYDDIHGWNDDQYMGAGEFYMDYADYDVHITVPEGWLIGATGGLQNSTEVLTPTVMQRLKRASKSDTVVSIVNEDERKAGKSTIISSTGNLTWHFTARNVRDFAFGTSKKYVWDATRAALENGKTILIQSMYRPEKKGWKKSATYCRFTIQHMSKQLTPYPWPKMTVVEGNEIVSGGMEYPMITLVGLSDRMPEKIIPHLLFFVTYHETAHMWFPMTVGSNEKAYEWMDEGLTSYNTNVGAQDYWDNNNPWNPSDTNFTAHFQDQYYHIAGSGSEIPSMRHADRFPIGSNISQVASYPKTAATLRALVGVMGEQKFREAYKKYIRAWAFKHPQPYDLFNMFNSVYGKKLDWLWTSMLYNTWTLDQAIDHVEQKSNKTIVAIHDLGLTPMPVFVEATYKDGKKVMKKLSVNQWLRGSRNTTVTFPKGRVQKIIIDPDYYFPDVDRTNNVWLSNKSD